MIRIHEGERLKFFIENHKGKKAKLYQAMGFKSPMAVYPYYIKKYIKPQTLKKMFEGLGITEKEFYDVPTLAAPGNIKQEAKKINEGEALLLLIEGKGLDKSFLARQLNTSRQTLHNWISSGLVPVAVKDKIIELFHLPGDFWQNPRLFTAPGPMDFKKTLDIILTSLDRIEKKIDGLKT